MDYESIKGIGKQIRVIWGGMKRAEQISLAVIVAILLGTFSYIIFQQSYPDYVQIFPNEKLQLSDSEEITSYLDNLRIPYRIDASSSFLVPSQDVQSVRAELTSLGIPKGHANKGYDLFENSTWIRGEKELQILEVRALKGQLEQDISQYDNVRSAYVILDIAPSRPFGSSTYRTKASIILNLVPGTTLPQSEIQAITYHVAGAVRGLMPNMVAISDTSGKLYQGWNPETPYETQKNPSHYLEERLKTKIDGLLSLIAGSGRYYSSIQILYGPKKGNGSNEAINGIYVSIVLDNTFPEGLLDQNHEQHLRSIIEKQVHTMLEPYGARIEVTTSFASFNKGRANFVPYSFHKKGAGENKESWDWIWYSAIVLIVICMIVWLLMNMFKYRKWTKLDFRKNGRRQGKGINLEKMLETLKKHVRKHPKIMVEEIQVQKVLDILENVEPKQLSDYLQNEPLMSIATMLSYLEPRRCLEILQEFPWEKQRALILMFDQIPEKDPSSKMQQMGIANFLSAIISFLNQDAKQTILNEMLQQEPELFEHVATILSEAKNPEEELLMETGAGHGREADT